MFFKSTSPILIHAVRKDKTVNHNYYIENCCQGNTKIKKDIILLHDNARLHTHSDVINYLIKEGIIIMAHPPCSSDY